MILQSRKVMTSSARGKKIERRKERVENAVHGFF